eukprot:TRINITY_DN1704_c0_g1_i2.p1 TRINITY_DN1704_c0_g1~~TRINITY_DN1704_c0_g1_i2.p1  ORF type:complete len:213 (+),score=69.56 TRINITY_DN1704_c0_g1_i2:181-819(+)
MASDETDLPTIKILVLGDSNVGKTCLLLRFIDDTYATGSSTVGIDFKLKTVECSGRKIKLQIWDTAGQERFRAITSSSYRGSHGVLICYDCTSEKSFRNVRNWALSLRSHLEGTAQPSIYIAATKTDVADKRVVDTRSGEELAVQLQARHFDTSSKNSLNVEEVFMGMAREIVAKLAATEQQRNTVSVTVSLGPSSVAPQPRAPPPEDKCKC